MSCRTSNCITTKQVHLFGTWKYRLQKKYPQMTLKVLQKVRYICLEFALGHD